MKSSQEAMAGLLLYDKWRRSTGISRSTGWRWRRDGWLSTLNIGGKVFVELAEVRRFVAIAKSGRFAKQRRMPVRKPQYLNELALKKNE